MLRPLDLNSDFNTPGVFWRPASPDAKFSAQVVTSRRTINLTTAAELFQTPQEIFPVAVDNDQLDHAVLNGFTSIGKCSLLHLRSIGGSSLQSGEGWNVRARNYRVGACLAGIHLEAPSAEVIREASFKFSGLEGWFTSPARPALNESGLVITYPSNVAPLADFVVPSLAARVTIRISPGLQYSLGGLHTARPVHFITIRSERPRELDFFVDLGVRLEHLFSMLLGTSVALKTVHVTAETDEQGALVYRRRSKSQKPDVRFWFNCSAAHLEMAIANWLTARDEFRSVETLIYETIRQSDLFVETEFLALAQALESLHRATDSEPLSDPSEFARTLEQLREFVRQTSGTSPLSERLISSIEHANEPSFHDRIMRLLGRLRSETVTRLLGPADEFERTLRQTRNHFTHPGIRARGRVLHSGIDLFLFNQRLHALLRILLLVYLGFSEEQVLESVHQQVIRWR